MTKPDIKINFTIGQPLYVHNNFKMETNIPMAGLVRCTDMETDKIYWINPDHITWIGPN